MVQAQTAVRPNFAPIATGVLQRTCACGQHTSAGGECEECKKKREGTLARAAISSSPVHDVPPIVHEVLRSPGQPLDVATRAFMEPRFGHDFSHVVVHTGKNAAESARAVHALAYTVGRHVVFGPGEYAPHTAPGQQLVAHELTHVVQQAAASDSVPSRLNVGPVHDRFEHQASRLAQGVAVTSRVPEKLVPVNGPRVQRQTGDVNDAEARTEEETRSSACRRSI